MKRIFGSLAVTLILAAAPAQGAWKLFQKDKEPVPSMLVLPFPCENSGVSQKMTEGFMQSVDQKVEVLDLQKFELYLASYTLDVTPFLDMPDDGKRSVYISTEGPTPRFNGLVKNIFDQDKLRKDFQQATQLEYLVVGKAKEKKLSDLEVGNLQTAQTADIKVIDLVTGRIMVDEAFKQGVFEIVAPDRIGKKFAAAFNKEFAETRKLEKIKRKREERELKRKGPEKRPYSY